MTAATVVCNYNTPPQVEIVTLTTDDGDTYHSRKFQNIFGAMVFNNTDSDEDLNVTWSADLATININGGSSETVTLQLYGKITQDSPY